VSDCRDPRQSAPTSPISRLFTVAVLLTDRAGDVTFPSTCVNPADRWSMKWREIPDIRDVSRATSARGHKGQEGRGAPSSAPHFARAAPRSNRVRKKKKRQSRNAPCVNRREYTGNLDVIRTDCRAGDRAYNRPPRSLALNWSPLVGADFSPANRRRDCAARRAATPLRVLCTAP